jgi:integrase
MVLRMPCPTKRTGSDNWYYRSKIPTDIQAILQTLPKERRPSGWYKTHISISLGTADRATAKEKCGEVTARVERQLKAFREGPKALTAKQVSALSGIAYRAFAEQLEANPGLTVEGWLNVAEANEAAKRGNPLLIAKNDAERQAISMEHRFGGLADATLLAEGIVTDDDSRWKLIEALARDLTEVAKKLARNADGDYSPDTYVTRFPAPTTAKPSAQMGHSLTGLADAWHTAALARGVRSRDAKRWRLVVLRFKKWLNHDDLRRVTLEKVQAWGDERSAAGIKAKTINDTDFAALRAVFGWGKKRGWLSSNPAEDAKIEGRGKKRTREKYFLPEEITAILSAALAVKETERERLKTTAAKHWVPWLCAYSGARVMEMIQLRKEDVRKDGGGWVIRLNPEAGDIKTDDYRDVPVHTHLVSLGFIDFVHQSKPGHLFCDVGKDGTTTGPADGVYKRILTMVRGVVSAKGVQPNHAWRYTFKTYAHEAGFDSFTADAICGHAGRTKGDDYRKVTLKTRMAFMAAFPRYSLG